METSICFNAYSDIYTYQWLLRWLELFRMAFGECFLLCATEMDSDWIFLRFLLDSIRNSVNPQAKTPTSLFSFSLCRVPKAFVWMWNYWESHTSSEKLFSSKIATLFGTAIFCTQSTITWMMKLHYTSVRMKYFNHRANSYHRLNGCIVMPNEWKQIKM